MKRCIILFVAFLISVSLYSQSKHPVFIGDFSPSLKASLISKYNSGKYNYYKQLRYDPPLSHCEDYLWNTYDSISGCDWGSIQWEDSTAFVTLPDYPDCPITVHYKVKICPNNPLIRQIKIDMFDIEISPEPSCENLRNYLDTGNYTEQVFKYQELADSIHFLVDLHEIEQMGAIPSCDSLNSTFPQYVFYTEEACRSKILLTFLMGEDEQRRVEYIKCSREAGCCKKIVTYCQDSLGNIIRNVLTNEPDGTPCILDPAEVDYEPVLYEYLNNPNITVLEYSILPCTNVCR